MRCARMLSVYDKPSRAERYSDQAGFFRVANWAKSKTSTLIDLGLISLPGPVRDLLHTGLLYPKGISRWPSCYLSWRVLQTSRVQQRTVIGRADPLQMLLQSSYSA